MAEAKQSRLRTFLAGSLSGTVTSALLQPLDVIRTHAQGAVFRGERPLPLLPTARAILAQDGMLGFYKGLSPTVARVFLGAGVYFSLVTELTKRAKAAVGDEASRLSAGATFAVGATARCVAATLLNPLSIVKTHMEWSSRGNSPKRSLWASVVDLARQERGLRNLFRGLGPTIARDAPYSGIYLTVFTATKRAMGVGPESPEGPWLASVPVPIRTFASGIVGGAIATVVVHPADTIRTRVQLRAALEGSSGAPGVGSILLRECKSVWAEGGLRAVFAGAGARVIKRTLSTALVWTLFEQGTRR